MAVMCPEIPAEFDPASREDVIFEALSKLPDEYYVFHSLTLLTEQKWGLSEHEIDFLVFHPQKGILCIEAKAGHIQYYDGAWRYSDGNIMKHGGPFRQASTFSHSLVNYIKNSGKEYFLNKCKIMYSVCFPSVSKQKFKTIILPPDADHDLIIFNESLDEIEMCISDIFQKEIEYAPKQTNLSRTETKVLLEEILAPKLNLLPIASLEEEHRIIKFKTMLKEQISLLDYLEEQRTAVISGAAGTGKTLMALEKAKRNAEKKEKVLFLCYNKKLQEYLSKSNENPFIDYYTIDAFACSMCKTSESDYLLLQDKLIELVTENIFPYKHIVIDEGQDFGQDNIEDADIIDLLYDIVYEDKSEQSSFYMFYDKNQLVQGRKLPDCINKSDCKLTLYRNCRNTENIAISSMRFLGSEKLPKLFEKALRGTAPVMFIENDETSKLDALKQMLDIYSQSYKNKIAILTCSTVSKSILSSYRDGDYFRHNNQKYLFTSCRKFKGLEADAVIIIDVKLNMFTEENMKNLMYVGASRARFELCVIANLSETDIKTFLENQGIRKTKNLHKSFATLFNAKLKKLDK